MAMQQYRHESDILRHRSGHRDTDRQMLADVWRQNLYDDDGHVAGSNGYDGHEGMQGLPTVPQPEEEEADEEHQAGDTFMLLL